MTPEQVAALRESATNIIAYEKSLETERSKLYGDLERMNSNARQAVLMANEASQSGDTEGAARFNESAEVIAAEIVSIDTRIAAIDVELIEAKQAADEARSIASDSALKATQMKSKGAQLRAEFEAAKAATIEASTDAASGVPSFDAVKAKIGERSAQAEAMAELSEADSGESLASATQVVEQAATESKAAAKLAELRSQLGILADVPAEPAIADAPEDSDDSEPEAP